MAEWLRTGLQIRLPRFDSGSGLQLPSLSLYQRLHRYLDTAEHGIARQRIAAILV